MNKDEYQKLVDELKPKEPKKKRALISFLVGGSLGLASQIFITVLENCFGIVEKEAFAWLCITMIFLSSFLTSLGFFDTWVSKCQAGLFLPTTGFAHSVTSAGLDYRRDGLISGLGSNFFRLAGSVLLYGMVSAFFLGILGVIIYG